jgi:hypothetical protein
VRRDGNWQRRHPALVSRIVGGAHDGRDDVAIQVVLGAVRPVARRKDRRVAVGDVGAEPGEAPVVFMTPLSVADELVRACCTEALERPHTAIDDRRDPSRQELPSLATAVLSGPEPS